ncbi:IclR family transcriptional regulator domain-containing protein [Sphingomonas crocodyli]|uniref:IclR family transcriptional regulator n=1 Tax=Sphingomonas crocodyli TaxID=1979270 RepID=A0A437M028_9SPHN|nr:helix-turn-helix domain-containing protein [Sphingomonas crocodyli]RVT90953.1 hypothetical protein EOD43_15580 [Sphingomonas crocodyli]
MKSSDRVHSLARGLKLLETAVAMRGGTVFELAAASGFGRTSVYRIADTLVAEGFLARSGKRYEPTPATRALSEGYGESVWIAQSAVDPIRRLAKAIDWPIALSTFAGSHMLVRYATDDESPYAFRPVAPGTRMTLTASAAGRTYLAFAQLADVENLLAIAAADPDVRGSLPVSVDTIVAEFAATRARGHYAMQRRDPDFLFVAVPIFGPRGIVGCLTVRIIASAMRLQAAEARYAPLLKATAEEISSAIGGREAPAVNGAVAAS